MSLSEFLLILLASMTGCILATAICMVVVNLYSSYRRRQRVKRFKSK